MYLKDQTKVRDFLEKLHLSGKVPGAILFYGPAGVGKTSCALDFSKGILCLNELPWGCDECLSCKHYGQVSRKILEGNWEELSFYEEINGRKTFIYLSGEHSDFVYVPPSGSSLKIDQIRGIKEFVSRKPALSKRKVVVIDEAQTMTNESANALLKVLEEPPLDTHIILISEGKESLLPTILSRTYQVEFPPLERKTFYELFGEEDEEIYEMSGGSITLAKNMKERKEIFSYVDDLLSDEPIRVYEASQKADKLDIEGKEMLLYVLEEKVRNSFLHGKLGYDSFEGVMERIREIRDALKRGIRLSLALMFLRTLWR